MAEGAPDLIIPVRMDIDKAIARLQKLAGAGKKAGDDVNAGAKKGKKGVEELEGGAGSAMTSLLNLGRAQMAFSAIKAVATAIGQSFKDAADHVKELAKEFADLRRMMQELAALSDEPITDKFVLNQAKVAQKFGMTMQENKAAQEAFKNVAGAQIGDMVDQAGNPTGQVAAGAKLTTEQGDELYGRVAQFMKSVGQKPELGMSLVGAQLQQAKGPQDVEKLMRDFIQSYKVAQKGPVDVKEMIPELQGIMSYGVAAQDAAMMFNIVAPVGRPGEAGTSAERAMTAIQKMKNEGTGKEFGVERGMKPMEAIRAFSENIDKRRRELEDKGMDEETANDELQAMLSEKGVVAEQREARGLVRGFAGQGVKLGGFAQYERIRDEVPADTEQASKAAFAATREGRVQAAQIRKEGARIRSGEEKQKVQEQLEEGAADVAESGELEQPPSFSRQIREHLPFSSVSYEQQLINREALTRVGRRAAQAGVTREVGETEFDPGTKSGRASIAVQSVGDQLSVNKRIAELLEKIEKNTAAEKEKAADVPNALIPKRVPGRQT